jgi:LemA protein
MMVFFFETQNNLISFREDIEIQKSKIETEIERRSDLIANLVSIVNGYVAHEEKVFTEIAKARTKLDDSIESGNIESINEANNSLSSSLSKLLVITENYPNLKISQQFTKLQGELAGSESIIEVVRQHYNENVAMYNKVVQQFPSSIVAGMCGFYPYVYFEADEYSDTVSDAKFA